MSSSIVWHRMLGNSSNKRAPMFMEIKLAEDDNSHYYYFFGRLFVCSLWLNKFTIFSMIISALWVKKIHLKHEWLQHHKSIFANHLGGTFHSNRNGKLERENKTLSWKHLKFSPYFFVLFLVFKCSHINSNCLQLVDVLTITTMTTVSFAVLHHFLSIYRHASWIP